MAFNEIRKGRDTAAGVAPAGGGGGALTAFIDQGSEFSGKLSFRDTVRIDGCFEGEISSENTLIVGEPGRIQASIKSATVIVSGQVDGNIEATSQITLHKTAVVNGDVCTPCLVVEEGARLNGSVQMGKSAPGREVEAAKPAGQQEPKPENPAKASAPKGPPSA